MLEEVPHHVETEVVGEVAQIAAALVSGRRVLEVAIEEHKVDPLMLEHAALLICAHVPAD